MQTGDNLIWRCAEKDRRTSKKQIRIYQLTAAERRTVHMRLHPPTATNTYTHTTS